ncbi:MAG TPA: ATP synthase F1 subunit delta [Candidatus Polarisedimenticolia bacterium]|nr:ATP synthase F1 subunit delta [Candidatus Polarisedimenticolia bacterium]
MQPVVVAKRYARALADHVDGAGMRGGRGKPARAGHNTTPDLQAVADELDLAARVLGADLMFQRFFADPAIGQEEKRAAIDALAKHGKLGDSVRRFLLVLVANRRLGMIGAVRDAFASIKDERIGIVSAETTTARPLTAAEAKRLHAALESLTGRSVKVTHLVDPSVLGGARTRIGSKVYDGTLRHKLETLRGRLVGAR